MRIRNYFGFLGFILICFSTGYAQSTDVLRFEYTAMPKNAIKAGIDRIKLVLNAPIKIAEDSYFILGAEYHGINNHISEELPFSTSSIEKLYLVKMNLGYTTLLKNNWRAVGIVTPLLASNFTNGIQNNDFRYNLTGIVLKDEMKTDKKYRLILGFSFNRTVGLPIPLPIISYEKQFADKWSYTLGIPRANFKHLFSAKSSLQLALLLDGYFINIQNDIALPTNEIASDVAFSGIVGTLGYEYKIIDKVTFFTFAGSTVWQKNVLKDGSSNDIYAINNRPGLYVKTGIRIGL